MNKGRYIKGIGYESGFFTQEEIAENDRRRRFARKIGDAIKRNSDLRIFRFIQARYEELESGYPFEQSLVDLQWRTAMNNSGLAPKHYEIYRQLSDAQISRLAEVTPYSESDIRTYFRLPPRIVK